MTVCVVAGIVIAALIIGFLLLALKGGSREDRLMGRHDWDQPKQWK